MYLIVEPKKVLPNLNKVVFIDIDSMIFVYNFSVKNYQKSIKLVKIKCKRIKMFRQINSIK